MPLRALPCIKSVLIGASLVSGFVHAEPWSSHERVQDLRYGEVVYEYHQGRSFEALTQLNVAKMKGGIEHHGDHPSLVEGGLMLSYGMTREAQKRFENVLAEKVSPAASNAAWFYLGKVFYLEGDFEKSLHALEQVSGPTLKESSQENFNEWHYLKNQISLKQGQVPDHQSFGSTDDLSIGDLYVGYNVAVQQFSDDPSLAITTMQTNLQGIEAYIEENELPETDYWRRRGESYEARELIERSYLTLGQWHLQLGDFQSALSMLENISYVSVFSDEALFQYAVAATHLEQYSLALGALNKLQAKESFTPWLAQVPYALAYLYEQMNELPLALEAYLAASQHYENRLANLIDQAANLSEEDIIAALRFETANNGAYRASQATAQLGGDEIQNDPYGRLRVKPRDFTFSALLAEESFQIGLRDLHELYKLQNSLGIWQKQLDSFDFMLETRAAQRSVMVDATNQALEQQAAAEWTAMQTAYNEQINRAVAEEDIEFFMDEEQLEFKATIDQVYANLALLPEDEDKQEYQTKIDRMNAYFKWWIADRYGANRWAVQSQQRALNGAMAEFNERRRVLSSELASDERHNALQARVDDGQNRLTALQEGIDQALIQARAHLMTLVQAELARQQDVVKQYLRESKYAQARLADALYQQSISPEEPAKEEQGGAESPSEQSEDALTNVGDQDSAGDQDNLGNQDNDGDKDNSDQDLSANATEETQS